MSGYAIERLMEFQNGMTGKAMKCWYTRHYLNFERLMIIRSYPSRSCVTIYEGVKIIVFERVISDTSIDGAFLNFIFVRLCENDEDKVFEYFEKATQEEMDSAYLMFTLEGMGDGREDAR